MKKRILLSLVSFFMMTSMWASLTEAFQVYLTADANGKTGANATLTLNLKNKADTPIALWTADVILPEGFTFVEGSAAYVPNRFTSEPTITAVANEDGSVTFGVTCAEGETISGSDGAVLTFEVAIDATVTPGDFKLLVKNAKMFDDKGNSYNYTEKEFTWTIEEGAVALKGDVNGDGELGIADAVSVLNAMAGEAVAGNPDVNGDGEIGVADFVAVLNILAGIGE